MPPLQPTIAEAQLAKFALYLFGAPRAELDSKPLVTDTRKAMALLAYLAVTRQPHTRDALATLLWPELDQTRARGALRRTLSTLHAAGARPWLQVEREQVALVVDDAFYCDVHAFERSVAACPPGESLPCARCRTLLGEAARLHQGGFLAGFTLRDSAAFDDWQFFQAEGYRDTLARVLETLVRCTGAAQDWPAAIHHARRWLALDPLHEAAQRQLMLLYAWGGQRAAALRQYQECVRILDEELGVPPLAETTAIYTAILRHETPSPPTPLASPTPPMIPPSPAPLVGREREWTMLQASYATAVGSGQLVGITGEAGAGKTALATAFAGTQAQSGAVVLSTVCYAGEATLAYAPLASLLQQAATRTELRQRLATLEPVWLAELGRLRPDLLTQLPHTAPAPLPDPLMAQGRFFDGLAHAVTTLLAGERPGLLVIDDLHHADDATLDWLAYFVHRLTAQRLCVVLVWRSDDLPAGHRLHSIIGARQNAARVELARLSADAVARWVAAVALPSGVTSTEAAQRLYAETEGLPFFVAEYLTMLVTQELAWHDASWPTPGRVREFVRARIAPLGEIAQQVLAAAATIGRSFELATVAAASGRREEETVQALEELLAHRLVLESGADRLDFAHAQVRQVVYADLSQLRQRLLHRRVGDALAVQARRTGAEETVAGVLAYHYQHGGEDEKAAHYAFVAGEQARRVFANRAAIDFFEQALVLGTPQRCAAQLHLGDLHTLFGNYNRATLAYHAALACCAATQTADVHHRLGRLYTRLGDAPAAAQHFDAAHTLAPPDAGAWHAQLLTDWALTLLRTQDTAAAMALAQQGLAAAQSSKDPTALARAHTLLGLLARRAGQLHTALRTGATGVAVARSQPDPGVLVAALNSLALTHAEEGAPAAALPLVYEALALAVCLGDLHREAALRNTLADLHHACGEIDAAMTQLKEAVILFAEIGTAAGGENAEIWMLREW